MSTLEVQDVKYYEDDMGRTVKNTRVIRMKLVKKAVTKSEAERKRLKKFGDSSRDLPGPNTATTVLGEPVSMQFIKKVKWKYLS